MLTHLSDEHRQQVVNEGLGELQEGVAVTHGAAEDTADDVAGAIVGRQLAVGNGEADRTEVVSDDAHGYVALGLFAVFYA